MSKVIIGGGGAGGIDFDDLDTLPGDVLAGKKFGGVGSDEVQIGTMSYIGSARKAIDGGLNPQGLYYHIPKGYYQEGTNNPWVYLTQPEVATIVGATPNKILAGQDICGVAGNVNVQSILAFNCAVYSSTAITFNWQNPAKGAFSGVIIVGKNGSYPTSIGDGTRYYQGFGNNASANGWSSVVANNFVGGNTYYFRCFSYAIKGGAEWIHSNSLTANAVTSKGQVILTSSGVWTVPANVRSIDVFLVGGGGGGGQAENRNTSTTPYRSGSGGNGGSTKTIKNIPVNFGQTFNVAVGSGNFNGGNTSFGNYSVEGGTRGYGVTSVIGKGGSGGGGGGSMNQNGKNGASDGADSPTVYGGIGQQSTTRSFGESGNTLYSGGGGGGSNAEGSSEGDGPSTTPGYGGSGGGGNGTYTDRGRLYRPTKGTPNTGGGGGGSGAGRTSDTFFTGEIGGSGVCIIRWGY